MTEIVIDDEQIRQILSAKPPIQFLNPEGQVIAAVTEIFENDAVQEHRRRLNIPAPENAKN